MSVTCPEHGQLCTGADCCCADKHAPVTADVQRELATVDALASALWLADLAAAPVKPPLSEQRPGTQRTYERAARSLLPTVQRLIADAEKRAAAAAITDLADDFDNGPFYAQATRYFADRDVDADGMDVARIIRAAALDPAGAASGETT